MGRGDLRNFVSIDPHYFFLRYEGFLVDMVKELSTMLGFTFTIHENPTGVYGYFNDEGNWTGMVAEVISQLFLIFPPPHENQVTSGAADMALAAMTITAKRCLLASL